MLEQETQKRSAMKCSLLWNQICIKFIKFLNKCFLLQSKYFFKVRFAHEIKLILPKCANIMRMSRKK